MATRPVRGSSSKRGKSSGPKSQSEINRVKPTGTLSLDVLTKASTRVITINVKFPDGEIYKFFHLPMSLAQAEEFYLNTTEQRLAALRTMLSDLLVNEDGSQFADETVWDDIDIKIINNIADAIAKSGQEEGGED
jgi:hypothetical protein